MAKIKEFSAPRHKMQTSMASKVFDFCNAAFMILFCISIFFPFWDMIVRSFSRPQDISYMSINFFPKKVTFDAYQYCFKDSEIVHAAFISVARTVIGTAFHIVITCLGAYTFTRSQMPFRKLITTILLIPMFIGGGMIPTYLNLKALGLTDNFLVYIIPGGFSIYNCIIIRNYFYSIDKGMEEAASIDGASQVRIFSTIIMPLSKPVLATVGLWQIVGHWNSWFDNMLYCRKSANLTTLQFLLRRMLDTVSHMEETAFAMDATSMTNKEMNPETIKAAVTIIVVTPIICIYPFLQKYFVKGIMVGAVKG